MDSGGIGPGPAPVLAAPAPAPAKPEAIPGNNQQENKPNEDAVQVSLKASNSAEPSIPAYSPSGALVGQSAGGPQPQSAPAPGSDLSIEKPSA